jgi:hypothetical protein
LAGIGFDGTLLTVGVLVVVVLGISVVVDALLLAVGVSVVVLGLSVLMDAAGLLTAEETGFLDTGLVEATLVLGTLLETTMLGRTLAGAGCWVVYFFSIGVNVLTKGVDMPTFTVGWLLLATGLSVAFGGVGFGGTFLVAGAVILVGSVVVLCIDAVDADSTSIDGEKVAVSTLAILCGDAVA